MYYLPSILLPKMLKGSLIYFTVHVELHCALRCFDHLMVQICVINLLLPATSAVLFRLLLIRHDLSVFDVIYRQIFLLLFTEDWSSCRQRLAFSKFYGKVGVIFWFLFHLIRKITFYTEILTWKFGLWIFSLVSLQKNTTKQLFQSKLQCRK